MVRQMKILLSIFCLLILVSCSDEPPPDGPYETFYENENIVMIEYKFNCELNDGSYQHILTSIESELIISSTLDSIINLIKTNHNP